MLTDLGHPFGRGEEVYDVTFENVQAGLRTDYLFRAANQRGGIVLGTGDLSELALGWCTYGVGDQMSHYGVNTGVPKTLMQHLIRWVVSSRPVRRSTGGGNVNGTLTEILDQEISPELVPTKEGEKIQSTEDSVGPYALQDFTLYHVLRRGYRPSKIAFLAQHAWSDAETRRVAGGLPRGRAAGIRPRDDPALDGGLRQALLRQPVQALARCPTAPRSSPAARCRRAATGGCRPTSRRPRGSPRSSATSPTADPLLPRGCRRPAPGQGRAASSSR